MFDVGQAGKDSGRIWGSEAPSALGIWSLRCPFADHGEQAVSESPSSGTCHPAVGGPGVSGERDRGWGTAPWGHQGLSGNGGRTSKEAEEELPGRKEGTWRGAWAAKWGACMVVKCSGRKGVSSVWGTGWRARGQEPLQAMAWCSALGVPCPCLLDCTFLPGQFWLRPCPGLRPLSPAKAPELWWGLPPASLAVARAGCDTDYLE